MQDRPPMRSRASLGRRCGVPRRARAARGARETPRPARRATAPDMDSRAASPAYRSHAARAGTAPMPRPRRARAASATPACRVSTSRCSTATDSRTLACRRAPARELRPAAPAQAAAASAARRRCIERRAHAAANAPQDRARVDTSRCPNRTPRAGHRARAPRGPGAARGSTPRRDVHRSRPPPAACRGSRAVSSSSRASPSAPTADRSRPSPRSRSPSSTDAARRS